MTLNHFNRRFHLYLALSLLPWFLVYGVSSLAIQHRDLFGGQNPSWEPVWERPYDRQIPEDPDWRQIGAQILQEAGFKGLYRVNYRNPEKIDVTRFSFWSQDRLTWYPEEKRLTAMHQGQTFRTLLVWMHIRSGFGQESFLNDLWAFIVDVVNVGFVLWAASGIYMWWLLPATRKWGVLALGSGALSFIWFLTAL